MTTSEGSDVAEAVAEVRRGIHDACARVGRDPEGVRLVAVTKRVPAERVRAAVDAGVSELGENYVQELERKQEAVPDARWHFLGRVQSNKAERVAAAAEVVQTLEPGRGWRRLADRAAELGRPLECLVQVDFAGGRVGVAPDEAVRFARETAAHEGIRLAGLMTVPPLGSAPRPVFARLRELRDRLREELPEVTELSMGMSADYLEAVEEGATMVRIGTAIFGPRA